MKTANMTLTAVCVSMNEKSPHVSDYCVCVSMNEKSQHVTDCCVFVYEKKTLKWRENEFGKIEPECDAL